MTTNPSPASRNTAAGLIQAAKIVGVLAAIGIVGFVCFQLGQKEQKPAQADADQSMVAYVANKPNTVLLQTSDAAKELDIQTAEARPAGSPEPLRLPGTLTLDPNRFVRVNARFAGEAVRLGTVKEGDQERQLQFGDRVTKGQLLAVIWSKDIGEKKSDLIDAYSRLDLNRALLKRLENLSQGIVAERQIFEARRDVEADLIAAAKIERTLRSWRLSEEEIEAVRREARLLKERNGVRDPDLEKSWAETEVRAAMDGVILEKNFNVGDLIEQTDDLFKIADLSRLRVVAHIYEEDLWAIRTLTNGMRKWSLDLKSDPGDNAIEGTFELIGNVIDPGARTGVVMGWVNNSDNKLAVGQFITATIQLPANVNEVAIPDKALIEEGDRSMVFVQDHANPHEFTRRRVSILRRSASTVYVKAQPSEKERAAGIEGVAVGEMVVVSSVLGLGGELEKLQSQLASQ